MTCIKNGAVVRLPQYNTTVVCDLYQIADAILIRFNPGRLYDGTSRDVTHVAFVTSAYINKEAGIIVTPKWEVSEK